MATNKNKKHFQVYDVDPKVRKQFVGLCKLQGQSASRTIEKMMSDYVQDKKSKLYVGKDD